MVIHDIYRKIALKRKKMEIFANFRFLRSFFGIFLGHSGVLGLNQKTPEISTNTYRTKLNLSELNSPLKVNINLVLGKFF